MNISCAEELLKRYREGKCTIPERKLLHQWYNKYLKESPVDLQADFWAGLEADILKNLSPEIHGSPKTIALYRKTQWRIVASLVAILGISWIWLKNPEPGAGNGLRADTHLYSDKQITKVLLPDSSVVYLNYGSRLRYQEEGFTVNRLVEVTEGEAFFEVRKDPHQPFLVLAGPTRTKVLGTSFAVSLRPELSSVKVTVATGKVEVEKAGQNGEGILTVLTPDQQLSVNSIDGSYSKEEVVSRELIAWKDGKLVFSGQRLEEIFLLLEKRFGASIQLVDYKLSGARYSASFDPGDSIGTILADLALVGGFGARLKNGQWEIYDKETGSPAK